MGQLLGAGGSFPPCVCLHASTSEPNAGTWKGTAVTFEGVGGWQVRFLHTAPRRAASCCRCCDGCRWTCVNRSELRPLGGGRVAGRKGRHLPGWLPSFFINGSAGRKLRSGRLSRSPLLCGGVSSGGFGGLLSTDLSSQQQNDDLRSRLCGFSSTKTSSVCLLRFLLVVAADSSVSLSLFI